MKHQFSPVYSQFKGKPKEAIKHLLKVKQGECTEALYRSDVGYIDIVWGENNPKTNEGFGLKHIIEKHGKEIESLNFKVEDFISIVIQFGDFNKSKSTKDKLIYESHLFRFVVRTDFNGKKKHWLLTSFDLRRKITKKSLGTVKTSHANYFTLGTLLKATNDNTNVQQSNQNQTLLSGNFFISPEWSFASFKNLVKTKFNKFNLTRINEFIEKLNTFKRIFSEINPKLLSKNGFNTDNIERYTPVLNTKLFDAFILKSDLLDSEQLPGQIKMFSGLGLPFDSARSNNVHSQDGTEYERQEKLSAGKMITGRECEISFTVSKVVSGKYALIEADYLQPSHIGNMQNPLHFIPEAQPRNRAMSQSGHSTPKVIAENLRPSEIIEGATAYTGAPITNMRGEVIQGNGRAYTMKYYYANYPKDEAAYKKWILKNGMYYGFKTKQIEKFNQPVMIRVVDISDPEAINLGQFTQKDLEAVASETTQVKSKAGLISIDVLNKMIDELLSNDNGDKTLAELIRDSNILKVLIKEEIIRTDDLELYKRNDVINETGVNFITKLLLNLIFKESNVNTPDVFASLPVALQKAIEKSALYILKCQAEQNISKEVGNAIIGLRDYLIFKPNGSISQWKRQIDIFGSSVIDKYSDLEFKLIEIFAETPTQKQIVEYFKKYSFLATDQKGDMFEAARPALSKSESVKKVFGIDLKAEVKSKATVYPEQKNKYNTAKAKALALEIELNLLML